MAIKLVGNYAKRLGLPGYSSHQFSVSIETELNDPGDIQAEATRIYDLLQDAVDREIQQTGFVPGDEYGLPGNGAGGHDAAVSRETGAGGHSGENGRNGSSNRSPAPDRWFCSDKQKAFIEKLIAENDLDSDFVEKIAFDRFGAGMRQLNKLQASGLIGELLELCGRNRDNRREGAKR